ncbi:hypothetical protein FACS1894206_04130 [Deltaproteobacteria bacterium]|nr:hypothetical protein FACS1894206_04130 [Deltaproteobacteria bacterium]
MIPYRAMFKEDIRHIADSVSLLRDALKAQICSRYFLGLLLVYCLGIAALLRADSLFIDDIVRAMDGRRGWGAASRPLADFFAYAFYLGSRTYDASPLTQLLSMLILALSSLLLLKSLRIKLAWLPVLCTVPVGLSPYILQCVSYKFDSPYMASAVFFAVLPLALSHLRARPFTLAAGVCLYLSVTLYHAALGAYLCLTVYLCAGDIVSRKKIAVVWRRFWRLCLPFLLSIGLFSLIAHFRHFHPWAMRHAAMPALPDLPAVFAANCKTYLALLFGDWNKSGLGLLMLLFFLAFIGQLLARYQRNRGGGGVSLSASCSTDYTASLLFAESLRLAVFFGEPPVGSTRLPKFRRAAGLVAAPCLRKIPWSFFPKNCCNGAIFACCATLGLCPYLRQFARAAG